MGLTRLKQLGAGVALVAVLPLALGACSSSKKSSSSSSSSGGGGGSSTSITARDFRFEPATLQAKVGQAITVTLKNDGSTEHNFSVSELSVDRDAEKGGSAKVTFTPTSAGSLQFFCKYHKGSGMTGTITVT